MKILVSKAGSEKGIDWVSMWITIKSEKNKMEENIWEKLEYC